MKMHRAVLFKDGEPAYHQVGVRQTGESYPYVMFADDLYVRWAQGDQHDKGRIFAYMRSDYYEIG